MQPHLYWSVTHFLTPVRITRVITPAICNIITIYFKLFLALIHLYLLLWNLICKALIFFSSLHVWQKHVKYSLNFETHYCWNLSELPYFSSYSILDNQSDKICISIKKKSDYYKLVSKTIWILFIPHYNKVISIRLV